MAETADDVRLILPARSYVASAIDSLSGHELATVCPIADWLVTLRKLLVEMRQYDGSVSDT